MLYTSSYKMFRITVSFKLVGLDAIFVNFAVICSFQEIAKAWGDYTP